MLKGEAYAAYVFELLHDYLNKSNSSETFYSLVYLHNGPFVPQNSYRYTSVVRTKIVIYQNFDFNTERKVNA